MEKNIDKKFIFKNARRDLLEMTKKELVGPGLGENLSANEEIITDRPINRYTVGILYPQKAQIELEEEVDDSGSNIVNPEDEENSYLDNHINIANQYYPSAMGISFYTKGINPEINVSVHAAKYKPTDLKDITFSTEEVPDFLIKDDLFNTIFNLEENIIYPEKNFLKENRDAILEMIQEKPEEEMQEEEKQFFIDNIYNIYNKINSGWKRIPMGNNIEFTDLNKRKEIKSIDDHLKVECIKKPDRVNNKTLFTLSLINIDSTGESNVRKDDQSYFQCGFKVNSEKEIMEYNKDLENLDKEEASLALLYRNKKVYAVGHGCSVSWENKDGNIELCSSIIPEYEVPMVDYMPEELRDRNLDIFKMINLSGLTNYDLGSLIKGLNEFCDIYGNWIKKLERKSKEIPDNLKETADRHLGKCNNVLERMREGIKLIENNEIVRKAFFLSNKAMLMQIVHSGLQKNKRYPEDENVNWPVYKNRNDIEWRPFQLAFMLMSIKGIFDPDSVDRDLVDLIWFPTGGGKTEAYLGVIALTLFLRRLKNPFKGGGTVAIMRYTLRLLTAQQFQRASALICACEKIRRDNGELGEEEFSIGLWIGGSSTPNYLDEALHELDQMVRGNKRNNKFQVLSCPWCGTSLEKDDRKNRGTWGYKKGRNPKRLILFCPEEECDFNREHKLPIKVIDEDIYRTPPSLLFSTVDKFALLPWKKEVSSLFALDNNNLSPELIIQDEMHLISGPLGTIVGLYETAIDALCSEKGIKPKILASTATVRRADDQCKALYNRDMMQFPPPGLDDEDSFFAREIPISREPGRLYAGIMSSGKTQVTTEINLMSNLLQLIKLLDYDEEIIDQFWTMTGYFNSLRELGRCSTMIHNNIKEEIRRIASRKNMDTRSITRAHELTSRKKAREIPEVLEQLDKSYPDKNAINVLLATNMISVGLDIDRLGLMVVVGQPKTTSEYIQATSRVGRKNPGLVFTLYDGARSRDRSHYEKFVSYHQSFYRYVEPTSVTPFSGPARDRALHAIMVSFIRHLLGLRGDNEIRKFNSNLDGLDKIKEIIFERVKNISYEELPDIEKEIEKLINEFEDYVEANDDITFSNRYKKHLLYPYSKKNDDYYATLQSMRNVDQPCRVNIVEYQGGGN